MKAISFIVITVIFCSGLQGQDLQTDVIKFPGEKQPLQSRWEWAQEAARKQGKAYWIGYSITSKMKKNNYTGMLHSRRSERLPILGQLIYGAYPSIHDREKDDLSIKDAAKLALKQRAETDPDEMVDKEMGFLIRFNERRNPVEFRVSTLDMEFDLKGGALFWLGNNNEQQSAGLIMSLFDRLPVEEGQEHVLMGLSMHQNTAAAIEFIARMCSDGKNRETREKAVFWLGQTHDDRWLPKLAGIAKDESDEELSEKAVFAISQLGTQAAIEQLAVLARGATVPEIRKKALFWLAQKASNTITSTLIDAAYNDESTELQNYAVFVLAEINDGNNILPLIDVAKHHPNIQVRKKAIFWLGQSEDKQAIKALAELAGVR